MSLSKESLVKLFQDGSVDKVKAFLDENPLFDINQVINSFTNGSALHISCWKNTQYVVSLLLSHPKVDVNIKDYQGNVPFSLVCARGHANIAKLFLTDSRVNINIPNKSSCTPLWYAAKRAPTRFVKWLIALRGDELDLGAQGTIEQDYHLGDDFDDENGNGKEFYTPIGIAKVVNAYETVSLLERFADDRVRVGHEMRTYLGVVEARVAESFALVIFLCDGLVKVKYSSHSPAVRFFSIAKKLPIELQMILCSRAFGSSKNNIPSKYSEPAFKYLAKVFSTPS